MIIYPKQCNSEVLNTPHDCTLNKGTPGNTESSSVLKILWNPKTTIPLSPQYTRVSFCLIFFQKELSVPSKYIHICDKNYP